MSTTPNYNINYEDEQFKKVEAERDQALNQNEQQYGEMIGNADKYYQDLIDQSKDYADKQVEIQNQNRDFAIEKIEQQREQAKKDYTREQSGAYVDWQKQSNAYGVQAEQMAQQGLVGSGYNESSNVAMFTAYQNRMATARETMAQANMNFDNGIKDAILQNNSAIAEIYANAHKEQLQISLEGFQYKNTLLENQMEREMQLKQHYSNEWQNVLQQMNTENALAEQVRQANIQQAQWEKEYQQKMAEFEERKRQFDVEMERLRKQDEADAKYKAEQLALQKKQLEEEQRQFNLQYENSKKTATAQAKYYNSQSKKYDAETQAYNLNGNGNGTQISTQYYNGAIAENVGGFGYMGKDNNGVAYQPKGVYVNGKACKVSKYNGGTLAKEIFGKNFVNSSGVNCANQNIWKAGGKYFIWNGTKNKYEEVKLK